MADNPVVVDAVSSPAAAQTQSVPVKIDSAELQSALQSLASQASAGQIPGASEEKINPSLFMKNIATDMEELYARFDKLKVLAAELNGLPLSDPFPEHIDFRGLTINFALTKDDQTTEHSVDIGTVASIGDITNLISGEFGIIISMLHERAQQIEDLAHRTSERCGSALKDWEAQNEDKQIVRSDAESAPATESEPAATK